MATFLFITKKYFMKNVFKLASLFAIVILYVISSCKKEEEIDGCTDSAAMNYSSDATDNDGSCIYAYDIAQGDWAINTLCDSVTIGIPGFFEETISITEMFPDSVEITGVGDNVVSMNINETEVLADIASDGTVTIQDGQQISFDTSDFDPTGFLGEIDVNIIGSGAILSASNGDLTLTMTFDILGSSQSSDCQIEFSR